LRKGKFTQLRMVVLTHSFSLTGYYWKLFLKLRIILRTSICLCRLKGRPDGTELFLILKAPQGAFFIGFLMESRRFFHTYLNN
jgi:hypothetical protein